MRASHFTRRFSRRIEKLEYPDFITAVESACCLSIETDKNYSPDCPISDVIDGVEWLLLGFDLPRALGFNFTDEQENQFHRMAGNPGYMQPIATDITWFRLYQYIKRCRSLNEDDFERELRLTITRYLRPKNIKERISPGNKWLKQGLQQFADRWNFSLPDDILRPSKRRNCSIPQLIERIENAYTEHYVC